jgi:hypothetical protein
MDSDGVENFFKKSNTDSSLSLAFLYPCIGHTFNVLESQSDAAAHTLLFLLCTFKPYTFNAGPYMVLDDSLVHIFLASDFRDECLVGYNALWHVFVYLMTHIIQDKL